MITKYPLFSRLGILFPMAVALASAQTPEPTEAPASAPTDPEGDLVVLSPFVVTAEEDSGYTGTATASGSRLKTDLKDVAASVTVLTNDFLDDLGAVDIASAMAFVAGAENDSTSDPQGGNVLNQGFVGSDFGDLSTRSGEIRVRGLGRASTAANYMQLLGPTDRYNIDRTEFLRGANSILFGLAEPAGLVNLTTKRANIGKDFNRVEVRNDNFGSIRGALDVNKVIAKGRVAVRAALMSADYAYDVETAYQRDDRQYFATTVSPFKGTTLSASYENYYIKSRRPNYRTIQDNVSGWLSLYNEYYDRLTPEQVAAAFYWDPTLPGGSNGIPGNSIVTVDGQTVDLGILRSVLDGKNNPTALLYDYSDAYNPLFTGATELGTITSTGGAPNPASTRRYFARSADPTENRAGYFDRQVTDPAIFPFRSEEISALPGNYRIDKGDRFNIALDQRITDDLFVSLSYQREAYTNDQQFSPIAQQQQISIDLNVRLPDGTANTNFLRPFIYGRSIGGYQDYNADNYLVQANYDFDFAKKSDGLGWLGFHRLTALYTRTEQDRHLYRWNNQVANTIPGVFESPLGNAARHVYQVWYIGDPVQPGDTSMRINGMPGNTVTHRERSYDLTYYNATPRTWQQSPEPIRIEKMLIPNGRTYEDTVNQGIGVSLQSFFWNRRIVTLLGWRQDDVEQFTHVLTDLNPPYLGRSRNDYVLSTTPTYENSAPTTTQSLVFHVTDWLRLLASRSENFAASSPRTDNLWRPIDPQNGETVELGVGLTLLEGKLRLRASYYESSQNLATDGGTSTTSGLRVDAFEDVLYAALESAGRLAEWETVGPGGAIVTTPYDEPLNIAATANTESTGWEIDGTYSPTPSWRISFGFSQIENKSQDIGHELKDFLDFRADYYKQFYDEGLRTDGTNDTNPSTAALVEVRFRDTVATNYMSNVVTEGTSNVGVPEYMASFVTNYAFKGGRLNGFSIGANLRWETSKIFGYVQVPTTYDIGGLEDEPGMVADVENPWMSEEVWTGGVMMNYALKVLNDRVKWKIQLNAQNVFSERGLRAIRANPDGSAVWGVGRPFTLELTNTFEF